jgi:hypothetical protein
LTPLCGHEVARSSPHPFSNLNTSSHAPDQPSSPEVTLLDRIIIIRMVGQVCCAPFRTVVELRNIAAGYSPWMGAMISGLMPAQLVLTTGRNVTRKIYVHSMNQGLSNLLRGRAVSRTTEPAYIYPCFLPLLSRFSFPDDARYQISVIYIYLSYARYPWPMK